MIRVAICEDEKQTAEELTGYLEEIQSGRTEKLEVYDYRSGEELMQAAETDCCQIYFLDIRLGEGIDAGKKEDNGIEAARYIQEKLPAAQIIFMTWHKQYVYDCFEVRPLGFLKKPLTKEDVEKVFKTAREQCTARPMWWEYTVNKNTCRVLLSEVCFFMSDGRKVNIQTRDQLYSYYGKLSEVEERLGLRNASLQEDFSRVDFVRISKSMILNMRYVKKLSYRKIEIVRAGQLEEFNISQPYRASVRAYCLNAWKKERE